MILKKIDIDSTREVKQYTIPIYPARETSLSKAKVRSKSMTCINCQRPLWGYKHRKTLEYDTEIMHRIYIKSGSKWKAIGWSCPRCGSIILDEMKIYLNHSFPNDPGTRVLPSISALKVLI